MDITGIFNLIQESRLLKRGEDVKPLLETKDTFWLNKGDILETRVLNTLPDGKVTIALNNRAVPARTNLPLAVGDRIKVEVQSTEGEIILKVLNRAPSLENLIKQELKPLLGSLQRPLSQTIEHLQSSIQSILTSSPEPFLGKEATELLTKLSNLLERFEFSPLAKNDSPLPSQPVSPSFLDLQEGENVAFPPLPDWIRESGIEWEAKLRALVENPPKDISSSLKTLLEDDLKGLTQKIIKILAPLLESEEATSPSSPTPYLSSETVDSPTFQPNLSSLQTSPTPPNPSLSAALLSELSRHLEHLSQTIQAHQWINAIHQDSTQQFYFQIPFALSDGVKPLDLFIYKQARKKPSKKETQPPSHDFWIVFFLTLSVLGPIRIDVKTHVKQLTLSIQTETKKTARHIAPFLPELQKALNEIGYHVTAMKVEQAPDGKITRPDPLATLPITSNGMISIVA